MTFALTIDFVHVPQRGDMMAVMEYRFRFAPCECTLTLVTQWLLGRISLTLASLYEP